MTAWTHREMIGVGAELQTALPTHLTHWFSWKSFLKEQALPPEKLENQYRVKVNLDRNYNYVLKLFSLVPCA